MYEIGTVCVKIAGRDAGKTCVVIDEAENGFVVIEGETRRRKCNPVHLEPTGETVDVKKGAEHAAVMKVLGLDAREKKTRAKAEKPSGARKAKPKSAAPAKAPKAKKAAAKKDEEKEE